MAPQSTDTYCRELARSSITPWCPVTELCFPHGLWKSQLKHSCLWVTLKAQPLCLKTWFMYIIGIKQRGSHFIPASVWALGFPRERLAFCMHFAQRWLWSMWLWSKVTLSYVAFNVLRTENFFTWYFLQTQPLLLPGQRFACPQSFPCPSLTSSSSIFWSGRNCIPPVSETKHCICCSILVILQQFVETSRTAIYRFTFCLSSSVQSVLTHCPSNLISHAAFKCRARPWPLSGGWQLSDTDSRLQILAAKTHSFIPVTDHCPQLETMLYSPPISWQEIYILY